MSTRLKTDKDKSSRVHQALLGLSQPRAKTRRPRLVTTNYDLLFESTALAEGIDLGYEAAPRLGNPTNHSWDRLTYLHGRLDDDEENSTLVLTSADFGLAYLIERWAARFVSELFATYTVLFVCYSLEDPMLRYVADAVAAEGRQTGTNKKMYSLASQQEFVRTEQPRCPRFCAPHNRSSDALRSSDNEPEFVIS